MCSCLLGASWFTRPHSPVLWSLKPSGPHPGGTSGHLMKRSVLLPLPHPGSRAVGRARSHCLAVAGLRPGSEVFVVTMKTRALGPLLIPFLKIKEFQLKRSTSLMQAQPDCRTPGCAVMSPCKVLTVFYDGHSGSFFPLSLPLRMFSTLSFGITCCLAGCPGEAPRL